MIQVQFSLIANIGTFPEQIALLEMFSKGTVSIRPIFGSRPIFFLILLNIPLCFGFMYANYLVEWGNSLEDIFKLSGWGIFPNNPTGVKQIHIQLYSYYIIL